MSAGVVALTFLGLFAVILGPGVSIGLFAHVTGRLLSDRERWDVPPSRGRRALLSPPTRPFDAFRGPPTSVVLATLSGALAAPMIFFWCGPGALLTAALWRVDFGNIDARPLDTAEGMLRALVFVIGALLLPLGWRLGRQALRWAERDIGPVAEFSWLHHIVAGLCAMAALVAWSAAPAACPWLLGLALLVSGHALLTRIGVRAMLSMRGAGGPLAF